MRSAIKIILFIFCVNCIQAQQVGMYSHYFYKPMVYNPAFTGSGEGAQAMFINRTQWAGIAGSPQLNILTADGRLMNEKAGIGGVLISDRKGITKRISGNVSYSYRAEFNENTFLAFGIALGVVDHSIDFSKAIVEDAADATLFFNQQRKTAVDCNAGLGFVWKGLEVGFAVPQLIGNKINYTENTNVRVYYSNARHFMGSLKYSFNISESKGITIAPQFLMRMVPNAPFQFDGNLNFDWKNKFWIGGTYKSNYGIGINAGVNLHKQIAIGYSYDVITGNIGKYAGVSHEIMISYRFAKGKRSDDQPLEEDKRTDTLQTQINELREKVESREQEAANTQRRLDSLARQLAESKRKEKELSEKLANVNTNQNQNQNQSQYQNQGQNQNPYSVNNQNKTIIEQNKNKVTEDNVLLVTNQTSEFKDAKNNLPKKGYYVIAGTFFYRDFAMDEAKRLAKNGYKNAGWVYFPEKQYNYVYLYRVGTKEEAIQKVKAAKANGIADAWIQVLSQ